MHNFFLFIAEVAQETPEGGLFDLDATLPLIAVQTLLLVAVLNVVFYKPFSKSIDEREGYVRQNRLEAQERLDQTKKLAEQYEQELADTRKQAQVIIADAQAEAQKLASADITAAQQEAQQQREQAQREIDEQRQAALQALDQEVDGLSQQIMSKLLSV